MRSWLIGFVVFGVSYTLIVSAIAYFSWPAPADVGRYGTFEAELAPEVREHITSVRIDPASAGASSPWVIESGPPDLIRLNNGHVVVARAGLPRTRVEALAREYSAIVEARLIDKKVRLTAVLIAVLVIPLSTFVVFAFVLRLIWNKLWHVR